MEAGVINLLSVYVFLDIFNYIITLFNIKQK